LKPLRTDRLDETLRRVRSRVAVGRDPMSSKDPTLRDGPDPAPADPDPTGRPRTRVTVETGGRTSFVERSDVVAVEASRDYVRLHTVDRSYLVRLPISVLEEEWSAVGFVRVHRSYLVSLGHVRELRSEGQGLTAVVGSIEVPVSRSYARNFRERLVNGRALA
jgi:DNA-binding LytR/AlgR family response regulator